MPDRGTDPGADRHGLPRFVLSRRQAQVLALAAHGLTWRETALALGIAPATVRSHLCKVRARLAAVNTTHAVYLALYRGIVTPEALASISREILAEPTGEPPVLLDEEVTDA